MSQTLVATRSFQLPLPESNRTINEGDLVDLDEIPHGSRESLLAQQWLAPPAPSEEEQATDWQATPIVDLGLDGKVVEALAAASLTTVADVIRYGAENGDLQTIAGIGQASEVKIQAAIEAIAK